MNWFLKLFAKKPQRTAIRLVSYSNANAYIERGWTIAKKEEDGNRHIGFVWLEKLEEPTQT